MSGAPPRRASRAAPPDELATLRHRLAEAEETLRAIRTGEVDAVVVAGEQGVRVFTLEGAEHAYRVLIESMNEGALTLSAAELILYANQSFARFVQCPLEQVIGSPLQRFLPAEQLARVRSFLKRANRSGVKFQALLTPSHGARVPVQISIRSLAKSGSSGATIGMVVTDMTDARRNETMLRELSNRLVQAQESERGRVALELHDHITQLLCATLVGCQTLADGLSPQDRTSKRVAIQLRKMLGQTADEVERISRNLRPSVLEYLGLAAVLRDASKEFAARTGVSVKLACAPLTARLSSDTELSLFRIFQEALKNVEKHAHASHVTISLRRQGGFLRLVIQDDGVGFVSGPHTTTRKGKGGLGLLSMQERAAYVGGILKVTSARRTGTQIQVRIPIPSAIPNTVGFPKS